MIKGFPTDNEEHQKRMIMATFADQNGQKTTILNGYFPQGDNVEHETKFPYKRQFYRDLMTYLREHRSNSERLVVMGDINISPLDLDIGIGEATANAGYKQVNVHFNQKSVSGYKRF